MSKVPRSPRFVSRRAPPGVARRWAWTCALIGAALVGCSRDPQSKIRGWPPESSQPPAEIAGGDPADRLAPDDARAPAPSDPRAGARSPGSAAPPPEPPEPERGAEEAEPLDVLKDLEPCDALLFEACALLGPHSEECIEARASAPGDRTLAHTTACAEILARWRPVAVGEARGNPCQLLARRKCEVLGENTRACLDARAVVSRLRRPEQRRACGGDLLLWEARQVLAAP